MKEFKGTKGKWCVENVLTRTGDFYKIKSDTDISVCNITTRNQSMAYANARLIASAPELAKRLNSLMLTLMAHPDYQIGRNQEFIDQVNLAKELLTKAIGE